MALIGMIEAALKDVPNPAVERAARERAMQKRAAFEAMLGNVVPNLEECDDKPCSIRVTNISPEIRDLADALNGYETPNFAELFAGKINSIADLFELVSCMMTSIASNDDYNRSNLAAGSKLTACGILASKECLFRACTADGSVMNDPRGDIARCFFEAVLALNASIQTPIMGYMFTGTVDEAGEVRDITSCFKMGNDANASWMALQAGAATESETKLDRYLNYAIPAFRILENAMESFAIDSASIYQVNKMSAGDALMAFESNMEVRKDIDHLRDPLPPSLADRLSMAIEEGLPQTAPEYDPTADLEEIEQTLAGIDQTNPELDPDQPNPDEQMEKVTATISDLMTTPTDTEIPADSGKLE